MRSLARGIVVVAAVTAALTVSSVQAQSSVCGIAPRFQMFRDLVPGIIGECLSAELPGALDGDALQRTTGGLLVWRKADGAVAFTDGYRTWVNGPVGLQVRL